MRNACGTGRVHFSDSELLAVILRSGTRGQNSLSLANEILNHMEQSSYPGLLGLLHSSLSDLKKIHGIGTVKAVQLKCIGELSKANCMCGSQDRHFVSRIRIRSRLITWNSFVIRNRK